MSDTNCNTRERSPTEVTYLENHWPHLQPHVREAIMTLVDGALTAGLVDGNGSGVRRSIMQRGPTYSNRNGEL